MAKKKHKKKMSAARPAVRQGEALVTLSQCMIVKNEEKNIEKALSWGKGIVCEQIVVDTGSSDHTVEIAERMGAKVFHFEWINDFSAAKNYALEQASGNWIAFLDADEYIPEDEAGLIIPSLELIMSDAKMRRQFLAVNNLWIQLDDKGTPREVLTQERIFRNLPNVRYIRRIHEGLSLTQKDVVHIKEFRIMHTGYTGEAFLTTGKASRNVELLREDLKENPNDYNTMAYLAESLSAEAAVEGHESDDPEVLRRCEEKYAEVEELYNKVLAGGLKVIPMHKKGTYDHFLKKYVDAAQSDPVLDKMASDAYREFPNDHHFMCYYAMTLNKKGQYREAFDMLKKCEKSLDEALGKQSALTTKVMDFFLPQIVLAAQGMGDTETVLQYAEIMLLMYKSNMKILIPYIGTLMKQLNSIDEVLGKLAHVYDMSSKRDLLLIARAAKDCGAIELARRIIDVAAYLGDE